MTLTSDAYDARNVTRWFARRVYAGVDVAPLLRWVESWRRTCAEGQCIGLVDSGVATVRDLTGAHMIVRDFTGDSATHRSTDHATHSATLLVGQGSARVRGLVPHARLLVANVVGANGVAAPAAVAQGLRWLTARGAKVIAIPLGDSVERDELACAIEDVTGAGAIVFAAAGNGHPGPLSFPARHRSAIAVGAADKIGRLLMECSREPRLDLIAPGHSVPALVRDGVVRRRRGTSVACVVAAGVAALAISAGAVAQPVTRASVLATLRRGGWP